MTSDPTIVIEERLTKSESLLLNIFWLGILIYMVSHSLSSTDQVSYILCNVFQILGLAMILSTAVFILQFKTDNNMLKIVFIIYCCWLLFVVLRGISFDYESIKRMLFSPVRGVFPYLVPLFLLYPRRISYYKKLFDVILILAVFYVILDVLFLRELVVRGNNMISQGIIENFSQYLSIMSGFVLLTFIYHRKGRSLFALFVIVLTFIFAVIRARRGLMFMSFTMLLFAFLIYQIANKSKVINTVVSFFIIVIVAYTATLIYNKNRTDTFRLITERFEQNTRSRVEDYFYKDMKLEDWLIGKGMDGEYFCPGVEEGVGRITIYRSIIETGYLQVILNGGLISLVLLLFILLPAIYNGFFKSKNILSKAAAIWIFLFLVYMYPGSFTIFSVYYILIWISAGICYSDQIRNMSDESIREIIQMRGFVYKGY